MKKSLREFAKAQDASQADIFSAYADVPKRAIFQPRNMIIAALLLVALAVGGYFLWVELTKTPQERMAESLASHGVILNEHYTPESILEQCFATEKKVGRVMMAMTPPDKLTILSTLNGEEKLLDLECDKDSKNSVKNVTVADSKAPPA